MIHSNARRESARSRKRKAPPAMKKPRRSGLTGLLNLSAREGEEAPKRGRMDISFFFLVIVLQTIGLIMLFSASYVTALREEGSSLYYVFRQSVYVIVGFIAMIALSYFDYHWWRKLKWLAYGVGMVLMVAALFFKGVAGAKRWVYIGPLSIQPSEIMKFVVAVVCAHLIAANYKRMKQLRYGFWPFVIVLAPVLGLMLLQRHLSGLVIIALIAGTMMFIGGSRFRWFATIIGIAAVGLGLLTVFVGFGTMFGYVEPRLEAWLDPLSGSIQGTKWQTAQGLFAIGSGGLFGVGLGNSTQKHLYVSEPQNDMIFSIVCEELGFVGAVVIILLFILLVYSGFSIAMRAPDKFGCMLAIGLTSQVGWQALLNIAVVTNSIPNTGISLPFFSAGGSALTMLLAQMGVILNISRYCRKSGEPEEEEKAKDKIVK